MHKVRVALGQRSYPILVGPGLLARLGSHCRRLGLGDRCAVITDRHVAPLYGQAAVRSLAEAGFEATLITVPAGEKAKSLDQVQFCCDRLAAHRLERKSFIVALGGGVVGDLAGFVAASYLRGLALVQVPTTLLAQVDSSVGGKTGVNLRAGKNLVGAFWQPRLVLCDLDTLKTLPAREYSAGLAEVIKYGIIRDAALFRRLERNLGALLRLDQRELAAVVARCCAIKAEVVSQDETEGGLRAILNFGHTIGHAIEAVFDYGAYLHGEAISIGQILAARLSQAILGLSEVDVHRIENLLGRAGLPVSVRLTAHQYDQLQAAMRLDKKVADGQIRFVLTDALGSARTGQIVSQDQLTAVLRPATSQLSRPSAQSSSANSSRHRRPRPQTRHGRRQ